MSSKQNNSKRVSLKDLAEQLQVSIATVSRALRGSHEVSEKMRQRVADLAKSLDYRPNPFAQSLRKDSPKVIGVILPNLVTHYYAAVLDGIEDYASQRGYSVITINSHEDTNRERAALDNFISMRVVGIIACLAQTTKDYSHFEEIHKMEIPLVFFARTCLPKLFSQVTANGDVAAREATRHLIAKGSRRVAFIGGPNHLDMVIRRKHGYLEALKEAALPVDRSIILCQEIDFQTTFDIAKALFLRKDRPDALLAFNDIITIAAFEAIKSLGLRIPEDVAIIGFSESDTCAYVTPKITAVMDRSHETGAKAAELLFRKISGDNAVYRLEVPMILKIRESSDKC